MERRPGEMTVHQELRLFLFLHRWVTPVSCPDGLPVDDLVYLFQIFVKPSISGGRVSIGIGPRSILRLLYRGPNRRYKVDDV